MKLYRDKQREIGKTEIRGVFVKTERHKAIKSHIKHLLRLHDRGVTDQEIYEKLNRIDLER